MEVAPLYADVVKRSELRIARGGHHFRSGRESTAAKAGPEGRHGHHAVARKAWVKNRAEFESAVKSLDSEEGCAASGSHGRRKARVRRRA